MPGFDAAAQQRLADDLKQEAARLGFEACGIAKAERLDEEAQRLETWLMEGRNASMGWIENHFEKRVDPRKLVPGAQTVVSVLLQYYQEPPHRDGPYDAKISRYAWGEDYHRVLKDKLYALYHWLGEAAGGIDGRVFTDSAPVLDKTWAQRAGLGWMGKHTNLIAPQAGSFFFLGELIVDVPLTPDEPFTADHCGTCTRCLDACPTDAIYRPYAVDARRCISYLTIENRDAEIADEFAPLLDNWVFGCDICQDVCPWNKFKQPTRETRFEARDGMVDADLRELVELDLDAFRERFRKTPVKRAKLEGLLRNARTALAYAERREAEEQET